MEPIDITKKIEAYLSQTLTVEEMQTFEKEITNNPKLAREVKIQQDIQEAAKRAGMRSEIKKVAKSYHFYKNSATLGIIVAVLGIASLIGYFILKNGNDEKQKTEKINPSLLEKLASNSPIDNLKSNFFTWNGSDSVIITKQGVLVSIPKDALLLNGKPFNQPAIIQWQEAMDAPSIVKSGLNTTSNGKLLETQGMFGIEAYTKDGKKLTVNPKVGIYVQVPVDQYKKGMMLFKGEKDKAGMLNWVNPKPLYKIPVSVDMKDLNFYPKGYEDTLDKLKLPQGRKYRDSLYASLEEGEKTENQVKNEEWKKWFIVKKINNEKYKLIFDGRKIKNISESAIYSFQSMFLKDYKDSIDVLKVKFLNSNEYILENSKQKSGVLDFRIDYNGKTYYSDKNEQFPYKKLLKENKNRANDWITVFYRYSTKKIYYEQEIIIKDTTKETSLRLEHNLALKKIFTIPLITKNKTNSKVNSNHLSPSKVLAFWNKKFNNTNLSTREFEARMKEIHPTCKAEVLALYVNNLNKSISEIDAQVAKMGYPAFEEFAKEQVGAVNPNNPHLNNLMKFYEKTADEISKKAAQLIAKQAMREKEFDNELAQARSKETVRTIQRNAKALNEEYEVNLNNVYKQLELEKPAYRQITCKTIGVIITNSGTYNIDNYVMDATVARSSSVSTDPKIGKTAKITYNDFSFQVKDAKKYPKLFAYLFPNKLNSYQRINGTAGNFDYPLNDDMVYHLAIVGINEDGFFYYK